MLVRFIFSCVIEPFKIQHFPPTSPDINCRGGKVNSRFVRVHIVTRHGAADDVYKLGLCCHKSVRNGFADDVLM